MKAKITNDFILNELKENFNEEIFLVGGAVRDFLTESPIFDRDLLVINSNVKDFSKKLAEHFNATFIELDSENEIYRIVLKDKINYLDITKPTNNSIEKDLKSRDLTINSLALNLKTGELIDVTNGLNDFNNKNLRCYNEKSILDDPLRLLRIFRFQAIYGFNIEEKTFDYIIKHKKLIHKPAIERINYEILKLFGGEFAHLALIEMDKTGLLEELFPFIIEYKKVPPNTHHHLDLFNHLIETVKQIQIIYKDETDEIKEHLKKCDFGANTRLAHLKFAGFLHDIGKFSTWTIEENGRHRFIKHDDVGAKIAKEILSKSKYSKKQISYLTDMIKYHIYPSGVMCAPEINDKIMMRFVRKMEENAIDIITLAKADRLSARGEAITDEIVENNIAALNRLQQFYLEKKNTLKIEKLLSGEEIMEILSINAGKELGKIISALHNAQLNNDVITKEDAINFVKNYNDVQ